MTKYRLQRELDTVASSSVVLVELAKEFIRLSGDTYIAIYILRHAWRGVMAAQGRIPKCRRLSDIRLYMGYELVDRLPSVDEHDAANTIWALLFPKLQNGDIDAMLKVDSLLTESGARMFDRNCPNSIPAMIAARDRALATIIGRSV